MISERDFVLNYFCMQLDAEFSFKNILALKDNYRVICENTSDESDTDSSNWIKTKDKNSFKPIVPDGLEMKNCSDGYHTFEELYDFRLMMNASLFNQWALLGVFDVHKSKKHFDGEECFGGGWFIVVAMLPSGQITNHYENKHWDLFKIKSTDKALFEFDGHTAKDVIDRLMDLNSNNGLKESENEQNK